MTVTEEGWPMSVQNKWFFTTWSSIFSNSRRLLKISANYDFFFSEQTAFKIKLVIQECFHAELKYKLHGNIFKVVTLKSSFKQVQQLFRKFSKALRPLCHLQPLERPWPPCSRRNTCRSRLPEVKRINFEHIIVMPVKNSLHFSLIQKCFVITDVKIESSYHIFGVWFNRHMGMSANLS